MNYNLNIYKLINDVLPSFLRGDRQVSWLQALTSPVKNLKETFLDFITQTNEELKWNGQTIVLENLLSLRFGDGITIQNMNLTDRPFYVYESGDSRNPDVYSSGNELNPVARESGSFDPEAVDFIVEIPDGIFLQPDDLDEMNALIRKYKIYSKRFKIEQLT